MVLELKPKLMYITLIILGVWVAVNYVLTPRVVRVVESIDPHHPIHRRDLSLSWPGVVFRTRLKKAQYDYQLVTYFIGAIGFILLLLLFSVILGVVVFLIKNRAY